MGRFPLLTGVRMNILLGHPDTLLTFPYANRKETTTRQIRGYKNNPRHARLDKKGGSCLGISCLGQFEVRPPEKPTLNNTSTLTHAQ